MVEGRTFTEVNYRTHDGCRSCPFFPLASRRKRYALLSSVSDPDPGYGAFLTPGSGMGKKSGSGSGIQIRDEKLRFYFLVLRKHFLGLKYLNSLMRIRDPGWKKFRSAFKCFESGSVLDPVSLVDPDQDGLN